MIARLTPHAVRVAAARAVSGSSAIATYCAEHFGRALLVIVDRYGVDGAPGERDAPYCWLYSDGDNELGNVESESFEFVVEVGAISSSLRPSYTQEAERTASANGLVLGGISAYVETLRDMVIDVIANTGVGACFNSASRAENSMSGFPLEFAAARMNFTYPTTLGDYITTTQTSQED